MSSTQAISPMERSTPTRTQADDLPPFEEITIPNIKKLSKIWDFKYWQTDVQLALGSLNLLAVVSQYLPKPTVGHIYYANWLKWSRLVTKWLVLNVEEEYAAIIQSIRPRLELADETYLAITKSQSTDENNMWSKEFTKLWSLRRHQFHSIGTYVTAWHAQVLICDQLNPGVSWYAATKLMLDDLKEEMPDLYHYINRQIDSASMAYKEFHIIVDGILDAFNKGHQSSF